MTFNKVAFKYNWSYFQRFRNWRTYVSL